MTYPVRRDRIKAVPIRILILGVALAGMGWGQAADPHDQVVPVNCPDGVNFEKYMGTDSAYFVQGSKVDNPFDFLPWVHSRDKALADEIGNLVNQKPFSYQTAISQALDILDVKDLLPEATHIRVKVRVDLVVVHCYESRRNVDLSYQIYTSQIGPALAGTPEGQQQVVQSPQSAAGLTQETSHNSLPSNLLPQIGFDSSDKLYAGGRIVMPLCGYRDPDPPPPGSAAAKSPNASTNCKLPLQLVAEGQGSQAMESVHAALRASRDSLGPILNSTYLLNYNLLSTPTGAGQVRQAMASLQYSGTSRAFFGGNVNARFGALIANGDAQSQLRVPIPSGDLTASAISALKLYGGLDSRLPHNVLSGSFGLELGTRDVASGIQWKKYIGDLHHDFWWDIGSHHTFDVETRLTAGGIQSSGPLPVAERFFGGNYEQFFVPDDSWQIRANPVIRAIPGSRFFETSAGAGADRFIAGNLTAAFAVWRKPLVPDEVRNDPVFRTLLEGQITTATSIDQLHYVTSDDHYQAIVDELPSILSILGNLNNTVNTVQTAHPGEFAIQFKACASAIRMATNRTKSAQASTDAKRYGLVSALLTVDKTEDRLSKIILKCGELNSALKSAPEVDLGPLKSEQDKIEADYKLIDQAAATEKAKSDMSFVHRTLDTLFKDVNLASISPVAIFDAAHIGPAGAGFNGNRYGPGGGVRLELASSVHFTLGYARNLKPGPGEGSGAIFFSMGLRDLFH